MREWNLLAAITMACAYLTACGLAGWVQSHYRWMLNAGVALGAMWSARQLLVWRSGGAGFASGWSTIVETAITVSILLALLGFARNRFALAAMLALVWVEYKVYGTSRRFNAMPGNIDRNWSKDARIGGAEFTGMDNAVYAELFRNPEYRLAMSSADGGTLVRHYGLATPQGFDPFLTQRYRELVETFTPMATNRIFAVDWSKPAMLEALAVRYVLTPADSDDSRLLGKDARYRLMEPSSSYFHVFELLDAKPAYRFEGEGEIRRIEWRPGRRVLDVRSLNGGEVHLIEQHAPGWRVLVDGREQQLIRVRGTFQGVKAPAGEHRVEFVYRSMALRAGAVVSLMALAGLVGFVRASRS
jgi:hypothetical protein